ncbi:MAG: hypothetical protein NTV32_05620, partial [Gammaproteobacteria bacterium]|nr:hypothetical protein [Gammaproteobacteria bacterium]
GIQVVLHEPAMYFSGLDFTEQHQVADHHQPFDVVAAVSLLRRFMDGRVPRPLADMVRGAGGRGSCAAPAAGGSGGGNGEDPLPFAAVAMSKQSYAAAAAAIATRRSVALAKVDAGPPVECGIVYAEGDGNCAFTATQKYFEARNLQPTPGLFSRENVVQRIAGMYAGREQRGLADAFDTLCTDEQVSGIEEWRHKMSRPGVWLGTAALYLAGHAMGVEFHLYHLSRDGNQWERMPGADLTVPGAQRVYLACFTMGADGGPANHYDALLLVPGPDEKAAIDRLNREYRARAQAAMRDERKGYRY